MSAVVRSLPSATLFALGIKGETVGTCLEPGCGGKQNVCFLHGDWATCWCDTCGAEVRVPVRRPTSAKQQREFDKLARERCEVSEEEWAGYSDMAFAELEGM